MLCHIVHYDVWKRIYFLIQLLYYLAIYIIMGSFLIRNKDMSIRLLIVFFVSMFLLAGCNKGIQQEQQKPNPTKISSIDTSSFSSQPSASSDKITSITTQEEDAIKEAINIYLTQQNSPMANATDVNFDKRDGDYVRVKLKPKQPASGPAIAFLHYKDNHWHVISIGTAFDISFYLQNDIPQSLILGK